MVVDRHSSDYMIRKSEQISQGIHQKLEQIYSLHGGKVAVNQAFRLQEAHYLIRLCQKDPRPKQATRRQESRAALLNQQAISLR